MHTGSTSFRAIVALIIPEIHFVVAVAHIIMLFHIVDIHAYSTCYWLFSRTIYAVYTSVWAYKAYIVVSIISINAFTLSILIWKSLWILAFNALFDIIYSLAYFAFIRTFSTSIRFPIVPINAYACPIHNVHIGVCTFTASRLFIYKRACSTCDWTWLAIRVIWIESFLA